MISLALVLGLVVGAGLATMLVAAAPAPRLDLHAALHQATASPPSTPSGLIAALAECAQTWRHPWMGVPTADLDLLEKNAQHYLARRLHLALAGLAAGAVLSLLAANSDLLPTALTVVGALGGAAIGWMWPYVAVRQTAAARRDAYRRVLAVYLDLVAQERSAGRAATPALREAAEASEHPLFRRIRATVTSAHRHGNTPWEALRALGSRIHLPDLVDVADLADTAAGGAAIVPACTPKRPRCDMPRWPPTPPRPTPAANGSPCRSPCSWSLSSASFSTPPPHN
ncbi:pilus assembly protein TadB [Saccharopolyspora rosea]|uniref:pilus assembly protein TadB n=1 Tax=Saccharopolyspora rosea TaxID=524884 RepID=UPI0021D86101|nr:pilus assembly protein TadB [Saccharopolyspora rosea]